MPLHEELRRLADDFDTLSDPARDDLHFIYKWVPPVWFNAFWPRYNEKIQNDRCVELAAVLREAAKIVEAHDAVA